MNVKNIWNPIWFHIVTSYVIQSMSKQGDLSDKSYPLNQKKMLEYVMVTSSKAIIYFRFGWI